MIGTYRAAGRAQRLGHFLGTCPRLDIDDARARGGGDEIGNLSGRAAAWAHGVADVGPVEAGKDQPVVGNAELGKDIGAGVRVGGRSERETRDMPKAIEQRA
jgi:hypothetical protein